MILKKIYSKYIDGRKKKRFDALCVYADLNPHSYYGGAFDIDIRKPESKRIYLSVGEHCIIEGRFVFENTTGQIKIGDRVHIGNSTLISIDGIEIGNDVTIAWNCLIYDHNSHSVCWEERKQDTEKEYFNIVNNRNPIEDKDWDNVKSGKIKICDKAWIGVGCTILKGVTIGEGAVVGAGSVVTKNVAPWTVVGGNPAKLLKRLDKENKAGE